MINSKIAWTDHTWTPIHVKEGGTYCVKVSPGCKFCYAEKVNEWIGRMKGFEPLPYKHMEQVPELVLDENMLAGWARRKKPAKNFVSSLTDIFGEFVPAEWVYKILDAMVSAPLQIFQVLTKRSERMKELVFKYCQLKGINVLPQNIWLMVSIEDQDNVARAVDLIATRCTVRGLSMEPLLASVDLTITMNLDKWVEYAPPALQGVFGIHNILDTRIIEHMDWIIVGGESGMHDRVMHPKWVYQLRTQCENYNVPFFFKQWGDWVGAKFDTNKGKVLLEDGSIFYTNKGHPPIHSWLEPWPDNPYFSVVSAKVGKKTRQLHWLAEPYITLSDNEQLDNKHYFNFPHYLNKKNNDGHNN